MNDERIGQLHEANRQNALDRPMRSNGILLTRRQHVDRWIAQGARVEAYKGARRLIKPDGGFFLETDITKTAMDYAESIQPDYSAVTDRQFNESTGNSSLYA